MTALKEQIPAKSSSTASLAKPPSSPPMTHNHDTKLDHFVGREPEARVILENCRKNRSTLIIAPSGMGKSALLEWLTPLLKDDRKLITTSQRRPRLHELPERTLGWPPRLSTHPPANPRRKRRLERLAQTIRYQRTKSRRTVPLSRGDPTSHHHHRRRFWHHPHFKTLAHQTGRTRRCGSRR